MAIKILLNELLLTKSYYNKAISNSVAIVADSVAFRIKWQIFCRILPQ